MEICEADPNRHYEAIARLMSEVDPMDITAEDLRGYDRTRDANQAARRFVALENDAVVGYAYAIQGSVHFLLGVIVPPEQRRRGIGTQLAQTVYDFVRQYPKMPLAAIVPDHSESGLQFARKHGFSIQKHTIVSRLEMATYDETPFLPLLREVAAGGIRITSLGAEGNTEANQRKLWRLQNVTAKDNPGTLSNHDHFPTFETYRRRILDAFWFRPYGQILAVDGDDYIGLSGVGFSDDSDIAYTGFTGVLRGYRGRKIAQAMKVVNLRYAQSQAKNIVQTENNSENKAMLKINAKLGFKRAEGEYVMTREA